MKPLTLPSVLSWKLSTRAARVHLAETRRAAFLLRSWKQRKTHDILNKNDQIKARKNKWKQKAWSHWRQRLHYVTVVDVACVGQQGCAAESRQRPPLSSQQHQITRRHLGQVSQPPSNTWNEICMLSGNKTKGIFTVAPNLIVIKHKHLTCIFHPNIIKRK